MNKTLTKKTTITLGLVFLLPVLVLASRAGIKLISRAFAGNITISSANQTQTVGNQFTMPINVNNPDADTVSSVEISATFDTSVLNLISISFPTNTNLKMHLPATSGSSTTEQVIVNQANINGKISFGSANFDPSTQSVIAGDKTALLQVATLKFAAKKAGSTQLAFNYATNNSETQVTLLGNPVTPAITNTNQLKTATITINDAVSTPAPSATTAPATSTPTNPRIPPGTTITPTPQTTPLPQTIPTSTPIATIAPTNTPLPGQIGNTAIQPVALDINNANILHAVKITSSQTIQVKTGSIFIGNAQNQTNIGIALYSDAAGKPATLIGSGNKAGVTNGWNTISFNTPLTLNANTNYWIATNNSGGSQTSNNLGYTYGLPSNNGCAFGTNSFAYNGTFPQSFGNVQLCSMYFMFNLSSNTTPSTSSTPTPAGITTIKFDDAPLGNLTTAYPTGTTWQSGAFLIVDAWGKFTTRNLSLTKSATQGTVYFDRSTSIVSVDAYNGGNGTSTVMVTCGSQTTTKDVPSLTQTTITTNFSGTCRTGTLRSSNGWDTNFDNLRIRQ